LNEPAKYAEIMGRLRDFDIKDAYRRLVLAEFKFARKMGDYFRSQFLGQTALISCFLKFYYTVADQAPLRFFKEYDRILDHHRQHPFSFPGETTENSGVIAWGQRIAPAHLYHSAVAGDDISYLHLMVSFSQHEYIIDQVLSNPILVNPTKDGRSLLLSAIISGAYSASHGLIRDLLKYGASPNHQIPVYSKSSTEIRITSIWAFFLFIVGQRCLRHVDGPEKVEEMFWIMEELIKSGADSNVYFLLQPKTQEDHAEADNHDKEGSDEADSVEDVRFITLEDLVVKERPPNMDTLLEQILGGKGSRLWNGTIRALSTLALWNRPFNDIETKYERARIDDIKSKYEMQSVYVNGDRLEGALLAKNF
jgi:hypothetical protein